MTESSSLEPAGPAAERIAGLFWGMTLGGAVIWIAVVALAVYALRTRRDQISERAGGVLIVAGGVALPALVLLGLLVYGLSMLPSLLAQAPEGSARIRVTGEQYWWRVRYLEPAFDTANELHLPRGETVQLELESRDVIHSLWVPALAGKVDMIPGRTTQLALRADKDGVYRGLCAEYCGASHAFMALRVVVGSAEEHARWLAEQAAPSAPPREPLARRGAELFIANGCGGCHSVRGTLARGAIGPDLTHAGSRLTLAAGRLGNDAAAFERFVAHGGVLKPGLLMPAFGMLPADDLRALGAYLEALQ